MFELIIFMYCTYKVLHINLLYKPQKICKVNTTVSNCINRERGEIELSFVSARSRCCCLQDSHCRTV